MDQVKAILYGIFVKHQFWTISLVLVAIGVAAWWKGAGQLKAQYVTYKKSVTDAKGELDKALRKPAEQVFNSKSHEGMEKMNAARRKEVYLAWLQKYQKQREEVLVWPEGLSKRFVDEIEKILQEGKNGTIEEVKVNPAQDPLVNRLREEYRDQIKTLLPKLAETIKAEWAPGSSDAGGRGPEYGSGTMLEERKKTVVNWSRANQEEIQAKHFDWAKTSQMGAEQKPPTTIEILYSMEDYWVLKAIMQIIDRTNVDEVGKPVTRRDMASIREIYSIKIGQNAEREGGIFKLAPASADGLPPAAEGIPPSPVGTTPPPPPPIGGHGEGLGPLLPGAGTQTDPAERRYVDDAYKPLPADKLRSAAESDNPDEAFLAVAKRIPVRLDVRIDQRKLNKFLIECGNSDLMLEVIQVRVLPPQDVFALAGTSQRGGGGYGAFGGGSRDTGRGNVVDDDRKAHIWDVDVQVYGIIYIFNPPSIKRLTIGLTDEQRKEFEEWAAKEAKALAAQDEALDALNVPTADPPGSSEKTPAAEADENRPAEPPAAPAGEAAKPPAEASRPAADVPKTG